MATPQTRKIFVETTSGERFEAEVPANTSLRKLAADFFDAQNWPLQDNRGRGQRAVVELVNPKNPEDTKRLNGDWDMDGAGVRDGDVLRIFPESIAGAVDQHARLGALISDHNDMQMLCQRNPQITFTANRFHAPDRYTVSFQFASFVDLPSGADEPRKGDNHSVEIILGADYPRNAPIVRWMTPIFHPNIRQPDGAVCLGVLRERYLPGMGLARLVRMLAEMVQWRNFDAFNPFNRSAAEWATNTQHWPAIVAIGGHPFQGPIAELVKLLDRNQQPPIQFRRLTAAE